MVCMRACQVSSVMSYSLRPYGLYPAKLLCPWNFLGKNSGVGCHFPFPGDLPDPRTDPRSPASPALAGGFFTSVPPGKPLIYLIIMLIIYCLSSLLKCKPQEHRDFCLLYSLPYSKCLKLCLAYSKCSININ